MIKRLLRDERGAAAMETAFTLPIIVMFLWLTVQAGSVFRAVAGMQHALGEGAREATIFPTPDNARIVEVIGDSVYGIGPGTFTVADPVQGDGFVDLSVTYEQPTDMLVVKGPTVTLTRNKRVYIAGTLADEAAPDCSDPSAAGYDATVCGSAT